MNYTLNQLQIFLKVSQTGSVTRAAEELHLTQPAVSIQLKNLQNQFEEPLTEVISRRIYITDFGKEIAAAAENIINEVYAINYRTQSFKNQLTGRLKISVVSTGKYVMPYFLSDFIQQNSGVELLMDVTNKNRVRRSLQENSVDLSLVSILPADLKVEQLKLMKNELYLVGKSDKKFRKTPYDTKFLSDLPLIFREKGSGTRQAMELFLNQNKIRVLQKMELTSNEAVKQAVLAGLGQSIMPLIGVKNEIQSGALQIIPVRGLPITTHWRMVWLTGKQHSSVAAAFLKYLDTEKEKIIERMF